MNIPKTLKHTALTSCLLAGSITCIASTSVYQTSRDGDRLSKTSELKTTESPAFIDISINPDITYQTIVGIGGAFTESSAVVLKKMSTEKRQSVIDAYFSNKGAAYSLMRTHVGGCDFSLGSYNYDPVAGDVDLKHFSIDEDRDDLLPLIKDAQKSSSEGFSILASPWTAPSWMKDNNSPLAGHLLKEHYGTYARYFAKYIKAYEKEGVPIWGITVINEPEGNGAHWDSMHMSPEEMAEMVADYMGPTFTKESIDAKILIFDQNRAGAKEWTNRYYSNPKALPYTTGTALHWYSSTYEVHEEVIRDIMKTNPGQITMHTEGCIDSINDVPQGVCLKDDWYWKKECMDWGYRWAQPQNRHHHPKYSPFYRYARNILGSLQSGMSGWIDWNIVLDFQGGPNHAQNWCLAPILCDPESDTIYKTPLFYVMEHYSKYVRPGALRIECPEMVYGLMSGAFKNTDGSIVVVILNEEPKTKDYSISIRGSHYKGSIKAESLQTIIFKEE